MILAQAARRRTERHPSNTWIGAATEEFIDLLTKEIEDAIGRGWFSIEIECPEKFSLYSQRIYDELNVQGYKWNTVETMGRPNILVINW